MPLIGSGSAQQHQVLIFFDFVFHPRANAYLESVVPLFPNQKAHCLKVEITAYIFNKRSECYVIPETIYVVHTGIDGFLIPVPGVTRGHSDMMGQIFLR
jgi:hypothetical protein